jgi:predicted ABC-type transport system involved in lysophospholipase L1 biosynthesis ATPase subunit
MTAELELREVSKVYGTGAAEVQALRRVSLSVGAGELVAVMGPSGSGKSTLLTIAGSLEEPTSGQVLVAGADLSGASLNDQAKMRRRLIGYVFQASLATISAAATAAGALLARCSSDPDADIDAPATDAPPIPGIRTTGHSPGKFPLPPGGYSE